MKVIEGWIGYLKDKNNLITVEFGDTVRFPKMKISLLNDCNLDEKYILDSYKLILKTKQEEF